MLIMGGLIMLVSYGMMWFAAESTKNQDETTLSWCHILMGCWAGFIFAFAQGFGLALGSIAQTGRPIELSWTTYAVCSCLYSTAAILGARQGLRSGLAKPKEDKPKPILDGWENELIV